MFQLSYDVRKLDFSGPISVKVAHHSVVAYLQKNDFVFVRKKLEIRYFLDKLHDELDGEDAVDQHLVVIFLFFFPTIDFIAQLVL